MGKELGNVNVVMNNKCGNCGNGGHSSKECSEKVALKLFGVRIFEEKKRDELMKKSFSVENLQTTVAEHGVIDRGYLSDGLVRSRRDRHGRKKGVPWTEEEHRTFLLGLKKLGKGDWRGISRKFVTTRTPTQVASHAQKYFLRQQVNSKKKRRSSLFDMPVVEDPPSLRSSEIAKLMETPRLEVPQASPMATCSGAINTHGTSNKEVKPGLMLRQSEARLFPTMKAFGNAAEFTNQFYRFLAKPSENFINSSGKPFVCQQLVPNCGSKMEGGGSSSSTVNTELELTIAPPGGVHGPAKLLGDASKMGGIIQVI